MTERRVVHDPGDEAGEHVLATEVELAESTLSKARGLMFRSSVPEAHALVMEMGTGLLGRPSWQVVHMLFVRFSIDVLWLVDDEVQQVSRMHPWRSIGAARADRILELPAGNADDVEPGDTVRVVEADGG